MIVLNAELAKHLATDKYAPLLADMPGDTTIDTVLDNMDLPMTPSELNVAINQIRAFWDAQQQMAQSFKNQAEDWRKIVETLRAEIDGLRPE